MTQQTSPVIDLFFRVMGQRIAVDHGYALYSAICHVLETGVEDNWLHNANNVGLIPIRGHYAGDGVLHLGLHARFGLRLPAHLIPKALHLSGKRLEINGEVLRVGVSTPSALIPAPVLYAHIVTTKNGENETRFETEVQRQLNVLNVRGKPERGPRRIVTIKDKKVVGYSLLVRELTADESIRLQEQGLGGRRKMGCGVFVARKVGALEMPLQHSAYQQLHNYPVGNTGKDHESHTKGNKYNITPARRSFLSNLRGATCV